MTTLAEVATERRFLRPIDDLDCNRSHAYHMARSSPPSPYSSPYLPMARARCSSRWRSTSKV
jgi:hypothetical protein